ncbi:Hypothetical predicted protein [Cloeon dipterum]|uniref:Gustatory receptor n=1 Tax=Cloeon dipterum TaxID=197152 RepID=A0A8S1DHB4_9INSE|nr:Hypothetical predicted protein [Cloeon dipterum]
MRKTSDLVTRLYKNNLERRISQELRVFSDLARSREASFSACGLFTIDIQLLFTAGGAILNYIFILSQLK